MEEQQASKQAGWPLSALVPRLSRGAASRHPAALVLRLRRGAAAESRPPAALVLKLRRGGPASRQPAAVVSIVRFVL